MAKRERVHVPEWWVVDKRKLVEALEEVRDGGMGLDEALERLIVESYPTSFNPES